RVERDQSARSDRREGHDYGRRVGRLPNRCRSDDAGPQAVELPRTAPAAALRRLVEARHRKGAEPMSAAARAVDLVVKGGRVVTGSDVVDTGIAIKGGRIVALAPDEWLPPADRVIDAAGKLVFPGLIDCHLHVGPEYDDWKVAAEAAARTGLTSVVPFVNYTAGETLPQATRRLREQAEAESVLDFGFHFILEHEPAILDGLAEAVRLGVRSFKMFMTYKKRGKRMVSDEFLCKAMEKIAALDSVCQIHAE